MRYRSWVIANLLLLLLSAAPGAAVAEDQTQPLRFLGNKLIAPFISLEDGKPAGIVVDLADALADKAGLSVAVEATDWPAAQSEVLQGRADALLQINPDPPREQVYDFSDPLLESDFQIFRKATRTDIQSLASLRGKKVGVESRGFPDQQLEGSGEFHLVLVPTWKAAFILLNNDRIDAVIVDRWVGEYELAVNRLEGITVVDPPVARSYSRIAVKKGNKPLLDKINLGLETIKQDGTYQRILDQWRPKQVVYFTKETVDRIIFFAVFAGGAILIVISIRILAYARALRKINIKLAGENAARRAAEAELAASHRNLEGLVARRTLELSRSEERLKLFIDRAPAAIAMFDGEMRYLAASRRFVADYGLSGLDPAALVGRSHYEVFRDIPERWRAIHRRVLGGETLAADEDPFPRADGRTDWVHWEMAPWHGPEGSIGGALLFTELVTVRKEAERALALSEAELRRLNRDLEARVQAEVAARESLQRQAAHAERMQALGQLAGGIAHDFNNVLQAIEGAAALIQRRPRDEASVGRMAGIVSQAVERGASITRRLLSFGRRGTLTEEAIAVAPLLNGMKEVFEHTLGKQVEVEVEVANDLPAVLADKAQLETALINLAANARDAMPDGGRLTLSAAAASAPPKLAPGRAVRFTVRDSGTGMDAATLRRATEPFFTTKEVGKGTGLGLSMVYGFVEQSGGAMTIESTPGAGTTVTFWLPVAEPAGPEAEAGSVAGARILLVDDEDLLRDVLAEQLEEAGYRVLVAASGTEAAALLAAGEPVDVLVTDLSMPGMDGLAVIRAAHALDPALPAVLLTGYGGEAAEIAPGEASDFSMLGKPVRLGELTARLQSLLATKQHHPEALSGVAD